MKWIPVTTMWVVVAASGCDAENFQATVDRWNAEFVARKTACDRGDRNACGEACRMSRQRQVCVFARQVVDPNNPAQMAWLARCDRDVIEQGKAACAVAEQVPPAVPTGTPPVPPPAVATPAPAPVPAENPRIETLRREMTVVLNQQAQALKKAEQEMAGELAEAAEAATAAMQRAKVRHAKPKVDGPMSSRVVAHTVKQHAAGIRRCYGQQLAARPTVSGKVTVQFTIDETGAVNEPKIKSSTLADQALESCIAAAVSQIPFSAPKKPVVVTYPLTLSTK